MPNESSPGTSADEFIDAHFGGTWPKQRRAYRTSAKVHKHSTRATATTMPTVSNGNAVERSSPSKVDVGRFLPSKVGPSAHDGRGVTRSNVNQTVTSRGWIVCGGNPWSQFCAEVKFRGMRQDGNRRSPIECAWNTYENASSFFSQPCSSTAAHTSQSSRPTTNGCFNWVCFRESRPSSVTLTISHSQCRESPRITFPARGGTNTTWATQGASLSMLDLFDSKLSTSAAKCFPPSFRMLKCLCCDSVGRPCHTQQPLLPATSPAPCDTVPPALS
mmetsp:Transcript_13706/g.27021  ORF Transcript_13706/g.27021 Transcript_13706/m.27021 type:complete len:274 (+) Transcript_13706:965-1786(+)